MYTKIKQLVFTISILFIIPIYADQVAVSKNELTKQWKIKEEQLNILNKKISELECSLFPALQKVKDLIKEFMEAKKQQLLRKNPKLKNADEEVQNIYQAETSRFLKAFGDINRKAELQIANGKFFEEGFDEVDAFLLRFYSMKMAVDLLQLKQCSVEWEILIKESLILLDQLNSI